MNLSETYPKLFEKIEDKEFVETLYDLISVDENYDDEDMEEDDVYDPSEYNYLLYITERLQNAIGEEKFKLLKNRIESVEFIEDFIDNEEDLYGIKSSLEAEEIAKNLLDIVENELL